MSQEVSDLCIIYDTPGEQDLPKETKVRHPIRFSLQTGMCQARCTGGCQALQTLPPQKTHKFCRAYCFSLNFYDYVQFKETPPQLHHVPQFLRVICCPQSCMNFLLIMFFTS